MALRADRAVAVFVGLYFWSPAHWQPSPGTVSQHTERSGPPAQNGDSDNAIYNGET
jgi:hypothetical protein